jgi:hypothetical protein
VLSRFGVMFFDDPVAAFANIRSATRPAGQLVFVCWQPLDANQWLLVPGATLAEHVPAESFGAGDGSAMFAFAGPDRIRQICHGGLAGHRDLGEARVDPGRRRGRRRRGEFLRTGSIGRAILAGADAATADRAIVGHGPVAPSNRHLAGVSR